ncbi:MAG: hypothetical protein R3C11_17955 [Planctomycetaceae bacterium]
MTSPFSFNLLRACGLIFVMGLTVQADVFIEQLGEYFRRGRKNFLFQPALKKLKSRRQV